MLLAVSAPVSAQTADSTNTYYLKNAVYFEVFGVGGLYSLNYDRRISRELDFRLGFTTSPILNGFPVMLNYLAGSHSNYFEIGVGALIVVTTPNGKPFFSISSAPSSCILVGTIGYRYQPDSSGYVFRFDITPTLHGANFIPLLGISVGRTF